jgi:hypothetical protein
MLNNFIPSMFSSLNGGEVGVSIMHCTALRVLPTFPPIVYHTYSIQGKYLRKVASINTSRLEASSWFFRLFMKDEFNAYILWTIKKNFRYTGLCLRLYGRW